MLNSPTSPRRVLLLSAVLSLFASQSRPEDTIVARYYDSGFAEAKGNYNGISTVSDGRVYYVLSTESLDIGAQMFVFDPRSERIEHLGDLTEASGEKSLKAVPQGKSHVRFFEYKNKLYFATHIGYYKRDGSKELVGDPPPGYRRYQGGHILSYDLATGQFEELGTALKREGIIALAMDTERGRVYCITWPTGYFFRYDVENKELKQLGQFFDDGELGEGDRYQKISRSMTVNPDNGSVFFNNAEGRIFEYLYDEDSVETIEHENFVKKELGSLDPNSATTMGYQWRQSVWSELDKKIYATHIESEYLLRLDPETKKVDIVASVAAPSTRRAGATGYGFSLGLAFGPDQRTLYHISHAHPSEVDAQGMKPEELNEWRLRNHHVISYDIVSGDYADLGKIVFDNGEEPIHINSLAIGKDGIFYALARRETPKGTIITDLISFVIPNQP